MFKKGKEKTGGKQKGTENKLTKAARELFVETLEKQVPNVETALAEVYKKDKAKYLELFAKYAQYFVPKKIEATVKDETIVVIPPGKK